jgi:hypothetical protein
MKGVATVGMHRAVDAVAEDPQRLADVVSTLRFKTGHAASWRSGAAYITLKDFQTVVVPRRLLKSALKQLGSAVLSVR